MAVMRATTIGSDISNDLEVGRRDARDPLIKKERFESFSMNLAHAVVNGVHYKSLAYPVVAACHHM